MRKSIVKTTQLPNMMFIVQNVANKSSKSKALLGKLKIWKTPTQSFVHYLLQIKVVWTSTSNIN